MYQGVKCKTLQYLKSDRGEVIDDFGLGDICSWGYQSHDTQQKDVEPQEEIILYV